MPRQSVDYSNKRVLLIDSSGNMRSTIYYMLRSLGVVNIRAATISERVIDIIAEESCDIILLGHNSSDSISGMQILEEARYRGYMKASASWVFMTSDASQEVVLHAIDSRPDAVLTKPFSIEELKLRLDGLMRRKDALKPVDEAIDIGDLRGAVIACDHSVPRQSPDYEFAQILKGRLLYRMGLFAEARDQLETWYWKSDDKEAGIYLAESLIELGEFDRADELLRELMSHYPLLIAAYDLLAKIAEKRGNMDQAQEILAEATSRSPMGIPRQMELGRVATYTRSLDVAQHAYRKSIQLGRKSCHRAPEPFLRLANVKRLELEGADPRVQVQIRNDLDALLNTAMFQFQGDQELKVKSALMRNQAALDVGDSEEARRFMREAENLNSEMETPLDLERARLEVSADKVPLLEVEPVRSQSAGASTAPATVSSKHDPDMSQKVNRLGVKHYLAGKTGQAVRYLGLAIEYDPSNGLALLNLAQLFLEMARDDPAKSEERMKMVGRYIRLTDRLVLSDIAKTKQLRLQSLIKKGPENIPEGSLGVLLR